MNIKYHRNKYPMAYIDEFILKNLEKWYLQTEDNVALEELNFLKANMKKYAEELKKLESEYYKAELVITREKRSKSDEYTNRHFYIGQTVSQIYTPQIEDIYLKIVNDKMLFVFKFSDGSLNYTSSLCSNVIHIEFDVYSSVYRTNGIPVWLGTVV